MSVTAVQSKKWTFAVNTTTELKNVTTTSDSNAIYRDVFKLTMYPHCRICSRL